MLDPFAPPPESEEPDHDSRLDPAAALDATLEAVHVIASAVLVVAILAGSLGGIFYLFDRWFYGL